MSTIRTTNVRNEASATNNLALDASGNVTIGNNLTVTGTTTQTGVVVLPAGAVGAPSLTTTGDTDTGIYFPAANTIGFATNGTEDARFDSVGNLLLNSATLSPAQTAAGSIAMTGTLAMGSSFLRNRIINGAMEIAQRDTSTTNSGTSLANTYGSVDRYQFYRAGAATGLNTTQFSSGGPSSIPYYVRMQRASGNTSTAILAMSQPIESLNSQDLAGQIVTLSFYMRAGSDFSGTTASPQLYYATSGEGNLYSGVTGQAQITTTPSTVTPTTSWQRFSVTGTVNASATQVLMQILYTPTGTAGTNDYLDITGVQLEVGSVATPFERRQYGTELALCQRYYFKSQTILRDFGITTTTGYASTEWALPMTMRAAPTVTAFGYASGTANRVSYFSGGWNDTTSYSVSWNGINTVIFQYNSVNAEGMGLSFTASAEL